LQLPPTNRLYSKRSKKRGFIFASIGDDEQYLTAPRKSPLPHVGLKIWERRSLI
jgi:hypothetical protein